VLVVLEEVVEGVGVMEGASSGGVAGSGGAGGSGGTSSSRSGVTSSSKAASKKKKKGKDKVQEQDEEEEEPDFYSLPFMPPLSLMPLVETKKKRERKILPAENIVECALREYCAFKTIRRALLHWMHARRDDNDERRSAVAAVSSPPAHSFQQQQQHLVLAKSPSSLSFIIGGIRGVDDGGSSSRMTYTSGKTTGPISITHAVGSGGGSMMSHHNNHPLGMENTSACGVEALLQVFQLQQGRVPKQPPFRTHTRHVIGNSNNGNSSSSSGGEGRHVTLNTQQYMVLRKYG
jgi:hypothetical protein